MADKKYSSFADFIQNASESEKEAVWKLVLERANAQQRSVIQSAQKILSNSAIDAAMKRLSEK